MRLLNWTILQKIMIGMVVDHPKLGCQYITTSIIEDIVEQEDKLIVHTYSGSEYELDFDRIDTNNKNQSLEALKILHVSEKILQTIREVKPYVPLIGLKDDSLYLETAGDVAVCAFYKKDNEIIRLNIGIHLGMIQDSVLIRDVEKGVDFRYFPHMFSGLEIYAWDGFTNLVINNLSTQTVYLQKQLSDSNLALPTGVTCCDRSFYYKN